MTCIESAVALKTIKAKDESRTFFLKRFRKQRLQIKKMSNSSVTGYTLQFPKKGTTDYVIITYGMPNLTAVTVCLWIKTTDTRGKGTPLSYAVSGGDNELILYDYRNFEVHINNHGRFEYFI